MFTYGFVGGSLNETSVDGNDNVDEHDDDDDDKREPTTISVTKKEISDDVKKPLVTAEPYVTIGPTSQAEDVAKEESTTVSTTSEIPRKSPTRRSKKRLIDKYKFECNRCRQVFQQKKAFKKHCIICKYGELKCKVCGTMFETVRLLSEHMDQEHPFLAWKCSSCVDRFTAQEELQEHFTVAHNVETHEKKSESEVTFKEMANEGNPGSGGSKQTMWTCNMCGKILCSKANLAIHVVTHRVLAKQFACDQCDAKFRQELLLRSHVRRVHCSPEKCRHCGALVKKDSMRKHLIRHHGKKPDHQCSVCFEEFETSEDLLEHKRSHREVHQCELCGKTFDRASALRYHTEWHSDVPKYNCDLCDKKFFVYSALRKHKNSVHAETRDFKCEICGKAFKTFHVFKNHRDIHDNERKHKCKVCGKGFNSSGSLVNHRRVHEREFMLVN